MYSRDYTFEKHYQRSTSMYATCSRTLHDNHEAEYQTGSLGRPHSTSNRHHRKKSKKRSSYPNKELFKQQEDGITFGLHNDEDMQKQLDDLQYPSTSRHNHQADPAGRNRDDLHSRSDGQHNQQHNTATGYGETEERTRSHRKVERLSAHNQLRYITVPRWKG